MRDMMKISNCNSVINKLTLTFLMILTLEGCEVPPKNEIPMPEKPYILKHDTQTYTLSFRGHSSKLSEEEQERLLIAIKPTGPGKVSTHVTIPSKGSHLGKQRLKHVIRILLADGVKSKQIHKSDKLPPANGNSIEIVLDTYRAIPPLCPNWSTVYGPGYNRVPPL
jgi:type IV pilus biogenesis protein CpaD/CtpE